MEKSLAELFVLAACGELPRLQACDHATGVDDPLSLPDAAEADHGLIENRPSLVQAQEPLVEKGLQRRGGKCAASESGSDHLFVGTGHDKPPNQMKSGYHDNGG